MIALAPLADVTMAIACLLLILAFIYFARTVAGLIPTNIPYVGSWLRNEILLLADGAQLGLQALYDDALKPAVNFVLSPIRAIEGTWDQITANFAAIFGRLYTIAAVTVPALLTYAQLQALTVLVEARLEFNALFGALDNKINAVETYIFTVTSAEVAAVDGKIDAVENYIFEVTTNEISQVTTYAQGLYNDAVTYSRQLAVTATAYADGLFSQVISYADTLVGDVRADIAVDFASLESYADTAARMAAAAAIGVLTTDIDTAVASVWPDVVAGATAVEGVIGLDLPDILAGLKGIDLTKPLDVAGTIAASLAISVPILKYMEQCGIPNCKNLSQYGRDLQALLGLVEDVSFIGMFVELAHNPSQGAADIRAVFDPIASATTSLGKELLSI